MKALLCLMAPLDKRKPLREGLQQGGRQGGEAETLVSGSLGGVDSISAKTPMSRDSDIAKLAEGREKAAKDKEKKDLTPRGPKGEKGEQGAQAGKGQEQQGEKRDREKSGTAPEACPRIHFTLRGNAVRETLDFHRPA